MPIPLCRMGLMLCCVLNRGLRSVVPGIVVCAAFTFSACSPSDPLSEAARAPGWESPEAQALYREWDKRYQTVIEDKEGLQEFNKRFLAEGARPCLVNEYEQALNVADENLSQALEAAIQLDQGSRFIVAYPLRQTISSYSTLAEKFRYLGERYQRTNSLSRAKRIEQKLNFIEQTARIAPKG